MIAVFSLVITSMTSTDNAVASDLDDLNGDGMTGTYVNEENSNHEELNNAILIEDNKNEQLALSEETAASYSSNQTGAEVSDYDIGVDTTDDESDELEVDETSVAEDSAQNLLTMAQNILSSNISVPEVTAGNYIDDTKELFYMTDFSEERAWVIYRAGLDASTYYKAKTAMIDTNGRIIFETGPVGDVNTTVGGIIKISNFQDGLSYFLQRTMKGSEYVDTYTIIDKDGNITFTKELDDDDTFEILGYGNGMFIIRLHFADFSTNEWRLGAIDKYGNEVVPLRTYSNGSLESSLLELEQSYSEGYYSDEQYEINKAELTDSALAKEKSWLGEISGCYYLGENIFKIFSADGYDDAIINMEKQSIIAYGEDADVQFFSNFENGYALVFPLYPDEDLSFESGYDYYSSIGAYKMDTDGVIAESATERIRTNGYYNNYPVLLKSPVPETGSGNAVLSCDTNTYEMKININGGRVVSDDLIYNDGSFYNLAGEEVIGFPEYQGKNSYACTPFYSGYAAMMLVGADQQLYITAINKNGDLMFEPKQGYDVVFMSNDGKYVITYSRQTNITTIFDISGNTIMTIKHSFTGANYQFYNVQLYNNGVLRMDNLFINLENGTVIGKPGNAENSNLDFSVTMY